MRTAFVLVILAAFGGTAFAEGGEFLIGLKGGGVFPQPFSKLDTSYLFDFEIGGTLPIVQRRLTLLLDVGLTQPTADGTTSDPRLAMAGSSYTWHLDQRELIVGASLIYREPGRRFTPFVGIGPRLFVLESTVSGQAGMTPIAGSNEASVKVGVGVPLGIELAAGPGHLIVEVDFDVGPLDHETTGDSTTGMFAAVLGYRFVL
jgi:hypothetical protein